MKQLTISSCNFSLHHCAAGIVSVMHKHVLIANISDVFFTHFGKSFEDPIEQPLAPSPAPPAAALFGVKPMFVCLFVFG